MTVLRFTSSASRWNFANIASNFIAAFMLVSLCIPEASADQRVPADLLPSTTVLYLEMSQPHTTLDRLKQHSRLQAVVESTTVQQLMADPDVFKLRAGIGLAEVMLGSSLEDVFRALSANGLCVAVDSKTEGVVFISTANDAEYVDRYLKTILKIVRKDADGKGQPDPVEQAVYRGINAYQIEKLAFAAVDNYLIVTNKGDLGKDVIDRFLDHSQDSLANKKEFITAKGAAKDVADEPAMWAFADVTALRSAEVGEGLFKGRADDFFGELVLGGILANLSETPYATSTLSINAAGLNLQITSPHDSQWNGEAREYFFGTDGNGASLPPLQPENAILSITTYRDISQLWLRAGDLFDAKVNDELATADSTLATLFSGRDFGEDILGAVEPQIRIVATRQDFTNVNTVPAIKLPAFALVGQLRKPDEMQPELRRLFQSLVGFLNVVGAMNGQPQLDLDLEKNDDFQMVMARYVPAADKPEQKDAAIQYNFSPALAFIDEHVIISSTIGLASDIVKSSTFSSRQEQAVGVNTEVVLIAEELEAVLSDNRTQLEAQNMLEKGHSKSRAEREISRLLGIVNLFQSADLKLQIDSSMTFGLQLNLAENPK